MLKGVTMAEDKQAWIAASLSRLYAMLGVRTQVELARWLGIRQSSISDAKRRGTIPDSWLVAAWRGVGANPDWILTGEGAAFLREAPERGEPTGTFVPAPQPEAPPAPPEPTAVELTAALAEKTGMRVVLVPDGMALELRPVPPLMRVSYGTRDTRILDDEPDPDLVARATRAVVGAWAGAAGQAG